MENVQHGIGDVIAEMLAFCYADEQRSTLKAAAAFRNTSFEQLVAAAIAQQIAAEFTIRSNDDQALVGPRARRY